MKFDIWMAEARQAWRAMLRHPGYLLLAAGTLALGVAACVSVWALLRASLLTPIAVREADRVVLLGPRDGDGVGGMAPIQFTHLDGLEGCRVVGAAAPSVRTANVMNGDSVASIAMWQVDPGFLRAVGMPMRLGRVFTEDENRPDGPAAAIVSEGWWRQHLGGAPDAIGHPIKVEGRTMTVVGVLPAEFPFHEADLLLPLGIAPSDTSWAGSYTVVARLAEGVSYEAAGQAATARLHPLDVQYKMDRFEHHDQYVAQPLEQALRQGTGSQDVLRMFAASASLVLLIVLVNLSNLALLRLLARNHDNAVRRALGAPLGRLLLPVAAEQLLVAVLGGGAGLFLAFIGLRLASGVIPPYWFLSAAAQPTVGLDGGALAVGLALATTALALAAAAWRARHAPMQEALVGGGRTGGDRRSGRVGGALVSLQAALATVLLMLAALCARTLWTASHTDSGFDGRQVLGFSLRPGRAAYPDQTAVLTMADALVTRLEALPGVQRAAFGTNLPASGTDHNDTAPFATGSGTTMDSVPAYLVSPGYLDVLGVPVLQGRPFDAARGTDAGTAIVSRELVRSAPVDGAVGRKLTLPLHSVNADWPDLPLDVRAVSGGLRVYGPSQEPPPIVWIPFGTDTLHLYEAWRDADSLYFMLRVRDEPASYREQVLGAVHEIAPTLAVSHLQRLSDYQWDTLSRERLNLTLVLVFAGAALLLSSVGMYSVMAVSVASRQHEFGIRAALGATPARLLRDVLSTGGMQLAIGLGFGLVAALAGARLLQRLFFGVEPADPYAAAAVLLILMIAGSLACIGPAVRAARVRPMQALRIE